MKNEQKKELCRRYFDALAEKLKATHEVVSSCNKDESMYLIPKGTISELSYYGKPVDSYRYSTHWNWYANTKKCNDPAYVQCNNADLPRAKHRSGEGLASKPVFAICIAYFGSDLQYHHIYGERFDFSEKRWVFEEDTSMTDLKKETEAEALGESDPAADFPGVHFCKTSNLWWARAYKNGKRVWIGSFQTAEQAKEAVENFYDDNPKKTIEERSEILSYTRIKGSTKLGRSGHPGIRLSNCGNWEAQICFHGKRHHLGTFKELSEAIAARQQAEKAFWEPFTKEAEKKYPWLKKDDD